MTKHDRFLHIERRREEGAPDSETADRARIAAVLDAAPPSKAPAANRIEVDPAQAAGDGTPIERVDPGQMLADAPDAPGAPELAIDTAPVEGQPFVRCARCGADSAIHVKECFNCSALLDTAEQRAFNERLWGVQRLRGARERAALAQMAEFRASVARASIRPLPEPGTATLPPELKEPIRDDDGPFLLDLLRGMSEPKWRWIVGGGAVVVPFFLVALGGSVLSKVGWTLLVLVLFSLVPRGVVRRVLGGWLGPNGRR